MLGSILFAAADNTATKEALSVALNQYPPRKKSWRH